MTTIPTLREALAKASDRRTEEAVYDEWIADGRAGGDDSNYRPRMRSGFIAGYRRAVRAVDQAVEALAGPDAGDGEIARIESQKDVGLLHDQKNYVLVGHSGQLYARFETTREDAQFVADAVRAALAASTPQPEPAAGGWRDAAVRGVLKWLVTDMALDSDDFDAADMRALQERLDEAIPVPPSAASPSPPGLDEGGVEAAARAWQATIYGEASDATPWPPPYETLHQENLAAARAAITAYLEATHGR